MPVSHNRKDKNLKDRRTSPRFDGRYWSWIVLCVGMAITSAVRLRLLNMPFERDEGEYAYIAQLMLQGIPPYKVAYSMKLPGIYGVYALIMLLFGQSVKAVHFGLLLTNVATAALVFLLAKRVFDTWTGVFAGLAFLVLSLNPEGHGLSANAEHFVLIPAIGGILVLLRALDSRKAMTTFLSGVLLGLGYLIKQHGAFFAAFAIFYLLLLGLWLCPIGWRQVAKHLLVLVAGLGLPFGIACISIWRSGGFANFWFWTFTYPKAYASQVTLIRGLKCYLPDSLAHVILPCLPIWILAGIGVIGALLYVRVKEKGVFLVGFGVASCLSVFPAYFFRRHYFILMLPFVAIMAAVAVESFAALLRKVDLLRIARLVPPAIFFGAIILTVFMQRDSLWNQSPVQVSRKIYGVQPFPESVHVANYIKSHTAKDELIAVIGSEPQIYFYARRRAAIPYIYMYPMMEAHDKALGMQKDLISRIERTKPAYIVFVRMPTSWALWPGAPLLVLDWVGKYTHEHYRRVGVVDIVDLDVTNYYWNDEVPRDLAIPELGIEVFQRQE